MDIPCVRVGTTVGKLVAKDGSKIPDKIAHNCTEFVHTYFLVCSYAILTKKPFQSRLAYLQHIDN